MAADPVLDAIVRSALDATGATAAWIVAANGATLRVVAAAGGERPGDLIGAEIPAGTGTAGLVVSSGQPMAMSVREGETQFRDGVAGLAGISPRSVLSVPCGDDDVVGALEAVNKIGANNFSFDDVEIATLLAGVAAAAISAAGDETEAPAPAELAAELDRVAAADPARYAVLARTVGALIEHA